MPEAPEADPLQERAVTYLQAFGTDEEAEVAIALADARSLVADHLEDAVKPAPKRIEDRAVLEVAAELFQRKGARNGVIDTGAGDGIQPFRIARDPMKAAYPLLDKYVVGLA